MQDFKHQRVLTGTRPSGVPHLGNFFGAYKPAIDLQDKGYELFFFLADYHALNGDITPGELTEKSLCVTATMLAMGLDPTKSIFYTQSHVPEVCELAWILGCQTPYPMLLRAHSFKDAQAKNVDLNAGIFCYPVLMAADILMYDAELVPVGRDQKQHLEIARDIATKFNLRYSALFKIPDPLISEEVAVVPGLDGEKMSKSKSNTIPLFATDSEWKKACMSIVTDSKGLADTKDPESCTIFQLYKLVCESKDQVDEMAHRYRQGGYGYGHAKLALLAAIQLRFSKARDHYFELMKHPDQLLDVLNDGSRKAKEIASKKMAEIKKTIGVLGSL